ncbi:MAG: diaminopropionate ammonia-lyase [Synergistaceae bacterium]|jgi:diaminopropionate ammonia-lyase|nr:diaminopropionate ammonia-lyase [Synergistaceae bacterium]
MEHDEKVLWVLNEGTKYFRDHAADVSNFNETEIARARKFHSSIPGYEPTPLRSLPRLAAEFGVGGIYVKDESYRFGLNAFKVLGASYAIARYLAEKLGMDISELPYSVLTGDEIRERLGSVTFATTTDGNHGRAVAWTARLLRQSAVVYMPKGSSKLRRDAISAEGARVAIRDVNYDESVRMTAIEAAEKGWVVVQDTAWPGYEDIPLRIMQGYGTAAVEALEQLRTGGHERPTHVFLQAGVGSFAGAVQGFYRAAFGEGCPKIVIAEANKADCYYRSALAGDGKPRAVTGDLDTLMAGLACGEPNTIAFDILRDNVSAFASCPDYAAARGMRILGNPLDGDPYIRSGESGAVTAGLLSLIAQRDYLSGMRDALKLGKDSVILMFNTEGDTDPKRYRSVVWDGEFPTYDGKDVREGFL